MEKKRETSHHLIPSVSEETATLAARFLDLRSESDINLLVFTAAHNYDPDRHEFGVVIDSSSSTLAKGVLDLVIFNSRQLTGEEPIPKSDDEAA